MNRRDLLSGAACILGSAATAAADPISLPGAKPVPKMQALPLPDHRASIQRNGVELTRYHFAPSQRRPFLYPVVGPSGRSVTRMGHPHATDSHSHHNSVWVSHNDVNGDVFWADGGQGRIVNQWIVEYGDGDDAASIVAVNHWIGKEDRVHLVERRGMKAVDLTNGEWLLLLDLQFQAKQEPIVLGKTPFGMAAVRMAKTIGVNDGGGMIRNSEGNIDEQGPNGVFWKRARWVDYSGPILKNVNEGITLFDHPSNPGHPCHFHVRADGWMGASLTFERPLTVGLAQPLRLRYGMYIHSGVPSAPDIERQWVPFSKAPIEDLPNFRK